MKDKASPEIPTRVTRGEASVPGRLRHLDKTRLHAVLATAGGRMPYASLVAFAVTDALEGVVFATPKGTRKYCNILKNSNVALLIDSRSDDAGSYLSGEAVTIEGKARPLRKSKKRSALAELLIRKHPPLEAFVNHPDTALVLVEIRECLHVTGFQKVSKWKPQRPAR